MSKEVGLKPFRWGNGADDWVMLTDNQIESLTRALQGAPAGGPPRDYAAGVPPQIEAQIKQATWAFFQSLVDTARASPETFQTMVGNAKRDDARSTAKKRDKLILAQTPAILDVRRFDWPGKMQ
jgi:hypothetical protein